MTTVARVATIALVSIAVILLATVVVQTLLAREAVARLALTGVSTAIDFDKTPPASLRSCVRSYGVVADLASTSAVALAMGGPPPSQRDSALFACPAVETLTGTYADLAWVALRQSSSDASALYEDLSNERVRYLMLAGTYVRAWAWREVRRGSFDVASSSSSSSRVSTEVSLAVPPEPGSTMPGVEAGTLVLVIARIDSLEAPPAGEMASTSLCRSSTPAHVPVEFPILASTGGRAAWDQLVASLKPHGGGSLPLLVWGFGGRSTFSTSTLASTRGAARIMDHFAMAPSMAMLSLTFGCGIALMSGVNTAREGRAEGIDALTSLGILSHEENLEAKEENEKSSFFSGPSEKTKEVYRNLNPFSKDEDKKKDDAKAAAAAAAAAASKQMFDILIARLVHDGLKLPPSASTPKIPGNLLSKTKFGTPLADPAPAAQGAPPTTTVATAQSSAPPGASLGGPTTAVTIPPAQGTPVATPVATAHQSPPGDPTPSQGGGGGRPIGTLMRALKRRYIGSKGNKR